MATFDQFIASLEQDFGEQGKGKPFEVFCKWFLENDPEWSKTVDKVWLWDDYPNKWQRQDLGTDLVFRDNEGLIWAVQAKCYGEHRTTTKGDMNSFLADTGRKEVDRRLWMQTTNKMEAKAEKTLKGKTSLSQSSSSMTSVMPRLSTLHHLLISIRPRLKLSQHQTLIRSKLLRMPLLA